MNPSDIGQAVMVFAAGICFTQAYNRVRDRRRTARIARGVERYALSERLREAFLTHEGCNMYSNCGEPTCPRAGASSRTADTSAAAVERDDSGETSNAPARVTLTPIAQVMSGQRNPRPKPKCGFLGCDGEHLKVGPR